MIPGFVNDALGGGATTVVVAALMAGLARGFSGFGAGLIFMPLASSALGPAVAAPLLLVIDFIMTLPLLAHGWRVANRRDVGLMAAASFLGIPLGVFVLAHADAIAMRWGLVALIAALLGLLASGWRYRGPPLLPLTLGVGATAGFLSGAAQLGGVPVLAYWLGGAVPAGVVRANLILFFALASLGTAATYFAGGLLTLGVLTLALVAGPLYGLGIWVGSRLFGLATESAFRRICYALIAGAAILSLPTLDPWLR